MFSMFVFVIVDSFDHVWTRERIYFNIVIATAGHLLVIRETMVYVRNLNSLDELMKWIYLDNVFKFKSMKINTSKNFWLNEKSKG